jgi:hypothetical protein
LKKSKRSFVLGTSFLILAILPFIICLFFPPGMKNEVTISNFIFLKCPIFKFFNILCPTCGLGRSFCSLFLFKIGKSWSYHPGGVIIYLSLLTLILVRFFFSKHFYKWRAILRGISYQKNMVRFLQFSFLISYLMWGVFREPF